MENVQGPHKGHFFFNNCSVLLVALNLLSLLLCFFSLIVFLPPR